MQRTISVSTDVYAAIWGARRPGEHSENDTLTRILNVGHEGPPQGATTLPGPAGAGFKDARNGVHFPEGFRIYRDYKRRRYEAVASAGRWQRVDSGDSYGSLNQLNGSIADGAENVWNGSWRYSDAEGNERPISSLRT